MSESSKPSSKPKEGLSDLAKLATRALARAQRGVIRENARYGLPLIVMKKGKVVAVPCRKPA